MAHRVEMKRMGETKRTVPPFHAEGRASDNMTMAVRDTTWHESYQRVYKLLPNLTKKELDIIADVASEFQRAASNRNSEITPLSEIELLAMADHAIEQADRGEVYTLEETMAYIDKEFEL